MSTDQTDSDNQRWEADFLLRERDVRLREQIASQDSALRMREFEAKLADQKMARWTNPLVLAVFAAAMAALGNAWLAYLNGQAQRTVEQTRSSAQLTLEQERASEQKAIEETKAEAARILEVIKTADPEKAATNLAFLLDAGLIVDDVRRKALRTFLDKRLPGEGPNIPPSGASASITRPNYHLALPPDDAAQTRSARSLLGVAVSEINRNVDEDLAAERILEYWKSTTLVVADVRTTPWSAAFLSWLIRQSGNKDLAVSASNIAIWNDAVAKKLSFLPGEKVVLPGDIAIFTRRGSEKIEELRLGKMSFLPAGSGVVYSSDQEKISSIEGNVGNAIRLRDHLLADAIIGFIRLAD